MFRIITLGDSFTWGIEVKDEECFPHDLEKILQGQRTAEVFNMGVGSYGIDQMLLKYLRHGRQLKPDVVVLGIYPHDYDRTRLSFYSYRKPIFRPDEKAGQYVLDNVPVPPPKEVYARLASSLNGTESYALVFLNNRVRKLFSTALGSNGYYTETDRLVEYLLARLKDELEKTGTKLLVVHIPPGHAFENDQSLSKGKSEPQTAHLRALYAKLKLPFVDLLGGPSPGPTPGDGLPGLLHPPARRLHRALHARRQCGGGKDHCGVAEVKRDARKTAADQ